MSSSVDCNSCAAMCCRYVATELDEPTTVHDYENIRWYLIHKHVHVFRDHNDDWFLEFETDCEAIGDDNRCTAYETRPAICREHGNDEIDCEFHGDDEPHDIRFSNAADFEQWLDDQNIVWRA